MQNTSGSSQPCHKGILQKSHDYEEHETPEHKIKWDENKLKQTEKQKEQVQMKVDEPNTPFVRYDPVNDKVTNWEDLPESVRAANEEPDDFTLDDGSAEAPPKTSKIMFTSNEPDEWKQVEAKEKREKEEAARRRHEEFERKKAQHYFHEGSAVLHKQQSEEEED